MSVTDVLEGRATWAVSAGDCIEGMRAMPAGCAQTCVTSPPYYGLRDYGHAGQIGLEQSPEQYVAKMVEVFREVRRILRPDGTLWLNLGDSYNAYNGNRGKSKSFQSATEEACPSLPGGYGLTVKSLKPKDLIGIPWMVAFALRADGWYLRQDIIWAKPNPMPESVTDRCTKAHEYVFLLSKSPRYHFDAAAIAEEATGASGGACFGKQRHDTAGTGAQSRVYDRPQQRRARELAAKAGLTEAHFDAIRALGITDAGKAKETQRGAGKNSPDVIRLAAEAKAALGGYYREYLLATTKNKRSVWPVATKPYKGAHFATMPPELVRPCVLAGCPAGGVVLDPFAGSGTTLAVAVESGRRALGCELNPAYIRLIEDRLALVQPGLFSDDMEGAA